MCETYSTSKQTHLQHVWKKQIKYWEQKLATYVYNHCNIYNILIHFCNIRMKTCNIRLKHLKHLKHTLATYAFRTTSSYCSREYKLLLTARENRSLSAYGVHQRKRPGTRSGEDGAHIEFKEVTDGSQKMGYRWSSAPTPSSRSRWSSAWGCKHGPRGRKTNSFFL
jgi:hypothetical protein